MELWQSLPCFENRVVGERGEIPVGYVLWVEWQPLNSSVLFVTFTFNHSVMIGRPWMINFILVFCFAG